MNINELNVHELRENLRAEKAARPEVFEDIAGVDIVRMNRAALIAALTRSGGARVNPAPAAVIDTAAPVTAPAAESAAEGPASKAGSLAAALEAAIRAEIEKAGGIATASGGPVALPKAPAAVKRGAGIMPVWAKKLEQSMRLAIPAYLVGPAGTGKTSAAAAIADKYGLPSIVIQLNALSAGSDIEGFISAGTGKFCGPDILGLVRDGGVLIIDEIDRALSGATVAMNKLAELKAGDIYFNPAGESAEVHPSFRVIATANTFGQGNNAQYCGANALDAATLNRFRKIECGYSADIEDSIVGEHKEIAARCRAIRQAADKLGEHDIIVSYRQIKYMKLLVLDGETLDDAEDAIIWAGVSDEVRARISAEVCK